MSGIALDVMRAAGAGITLLRRDGDAGQAILFLHGIGGRATSFEALMVAWPRGPLLLAWDAPGYGESQPVSGAKPVPPDYADRIVKLLGDVGLEQIDIIGQSLGGLIAGAFARAYPRRLRKLVLLAPALGNRVSVGSALPTVVAQRIADLEALGPEKFAISRASRLVHAPQTKPDILAKVTAAMATVTRAGYSQAVHALAQGDLLVDAPYIESPTLVLTGRDDQVTPLAASQSVYEVLRLSQNCPRALFAAIPDSGHAAYFEAPDAIIQHITAFLGASPA